MKKMMVILLAALLSVSVAACNKETGKPVENAETAPNQNVEATPEPEPEPAPEIMPAGGWAIAEDTSITAERKAVFDKALEGLVGVNYVPVAYLGSQVVAGTNHCFLTQATIVYPDAVPMFTLVYIYEDLSGNAEILNIANMPVVPVDGGTAAEAPGDEMLMGGWAYAESPEITDEIKARLEKALEQLVGANYEPIANLATQVVAGTNRCLLCKVTPVVPNAVADYALVYVYEDLEGGAQVLYVISFAIDMQNYLPDGDAEAEIGDAIGDGTADLGEMLAGGWEVAYETGMTDELRAIFDKALNELVGVDYEPIALLGTQVVAGTNYCFLAQATVVYPGAQPYYVLVYIYQDLEGNAQIMNFADMPVVPNEDGTASAVEEMTSGGWFYTESYEITDEIEAKFGAALNSYGYLAVYEPVANLAEQVVAGTNRCLLVRFTERIPDALPEYKLMYVYEALDGTAEMLNVLDFDLGALCTYGA